MKYPQLVSNRAVSTISDWLITRLEVLGVEAPIVYSRLLLSLLHTPLQVDSVDLADIPQLKVSALLFLKKFVCSQVTVIEESLLILVRLDKWIWPFNGVFSLFHLPCSVQNCLGKRFNSRRLTRSDAERLKRGAAIESLMEVVEDNEKVRMNELQMEYVELTLCICYIYSDHELWIW